MNIEKARDFFSAYYEETLEQGLRQSFEQRLRADKQLQAEYKAFVQTMEDLGTLKFEEIPIPIYLDARITARLDDARKPAKKEKGLVFYLPRFGIVAAAAAAIIATVITIPQFGRVSKPVPAGIWQVGNGPDTPPAPSQTWPMESIQVSGSGSNANIHYSSATDHTVKISDRTGKELKTIMLTGKQQLGQQLTNPNPGATIFEVQVSDGGPDVLLAVPGTERKTAAGNASGSLVEFAVALANQYNKPVIVDSMNRNQPVTWSFDNSVAKDATDRAFDGLPLQEVQTSSGILSLKDK